MRIFLILTFLTFTFSLNAQTSAEMRESVKLERQATADYKAKDYAKFLENTKQASDLRPNHARLLYNLADAYALNNQPAESLAILERLAAMDLFFDVGKDDDFKTLFDLPRFKKIQSEFALNQKAINRSQKALTIPNKDLITEGIAFDPKTKRFFVSSIHKRKIVSIDKNGKVSDFSLESDGLWSVSGMRVDEKRNVLWAATTAFPQMENFQKADDGKSAIFKYDLKTGKLLKNIRFQTQMQNTRSAIWSLQKTAMFTHPTAFRRTFTALQITKTNSNFFFRAIISRRFKVWLFRRTKNICSPPIIQKAFSESH